MGVEHQVQIMWSLVGPRPTNLPLALPAGGGEGGAKTKGIQRKGELGGGDGGRGKKKKHNQCGKNLICIFFCAPHSPPAPISSCSSFGAGGLDLPRTK